RPARPVRPSPAPDHERRGSGRCRGFACARKRANTNTRKRSATGSPGRSERWGVWGPSRGPHVEGMACRVQSSHGVTRFMSHPRRFAKMTKRMTAAIAGLGLLATTMTACSTLAGAGLGAGAGAAVGAGTGYGAGKGALIGTGVGAAAGAIYGATKK